MNTIKCCVCGKELKVGDKIYKDEKTLDYHCSLECMLDFYTTYTEQTLDEEFFDYCDDYYDDEEYEEEDEDNTFYDLNFIEVMKLLDEKQARRITEEFDIMTEDLNENSMSFEYYRNNNNEWILGVSETDKDRFDKRIKFILDIIKRSGGF
jgi:hypothetical protein